MAFKCMVCTKDVPSTAVLRNESKVCSKECHKVYTAELKKLRFGEGHCYACQRPVSPRERGALRRFRIFESVYAHLLYRREFKAFAAAGGTAEEFNLKVQQEDGLIPDDRRTKDVAETKGDWRGNTEEISRAFSG